jgi:hypothetical protein
LSPPTSSSVFLAAAARRLVGVAVERTSRRTTPNVSVRAQASRTSNSVRNSEPGDGVARTCCRRTRLMISSAPIQQSVPIGDQPLHRAGRSRRGAVRRPE